ncbi:MAG TPA: hypothetical protein VFP72_23025 [Kineosporiaceae bacterium]|nr:hypothetical protein [Kineosporiaceae bacterium]
MRTSDTAHVCSVCGTEAPSATPPYTWSLSIGHTGRIWTCVPCARAQLDHIEARRAVAA